MTTTEHMLQDRSSPALPRSVMTVAGAIMALIVAGVIGILYVGANGYYILSPGNAPIVTASGECRSVGGGSFALPDGRPCVQLVLPAGKAHPLDGTIMMVDVLQGKPTPWQFLLYKFGQLKRFDNDSVFLPNVDIIGNGSAAQLGCQDTEQAMEATSAAPVAALRRLGYSVKEEDLGAQIDEVVPGTPAAAAGIQCDDLVTAVNNHPVHTDTDVATAIHGLPAGTVVHVTVSRSDPSGRGTAHTVVLTARLGATPGAPGQASNPKQGFLGIVSETRTSYDFPFPINVQVGAIGGPSDGLALALGLIDTLSQGHLTGGLDIAATGEIDPQGNVIEIGGAAQKAVAVRKAGAKVFLVPPQNYADAKSEAGNMKVFAVATLTQALADLASLGGQIPVPSAPPTSTAAGA